MNVNIELCGYKMVTIVVYTIMKNKLEKLLKSWRDFYMVAVEVL
ncbi:hypothetical protein [Halarcobacter ebronensis]|nr:hypothetical protein [Halarcobacter ebronensis]